MPRLADIVESEESWWWEPNKSAPNDFRMRVRNPSSTPISGLLLKIYEGQCIPLQSNPNTKWNYFVLQFSSSLEANYAAVIRTDLPFTTHFSGCAIVDALYAGGNGPSGTPAAPLGDIAVPLQKQGGTYAIPVLINSAITLDFVVDSGADDVNIPSDVVTTLFRTGTVKTTDFIGDKTYVLADGSTIPSPTFRIRSLRVGDKIVENVTASVAPVKGMLLLGQSFLSHFKSWSIDNNRHVLILME